MKKTHILPAFTAFVCSSLILSGCIKSNEYLQRLDDIGKSCKIQTFIYTSASTPGVDTLSFHYNIFGDPDSATYPPNSTQQSFYFRYDSHHRLLDFINAYPAGNAGFWFRFFYPNAASASPSTDTFYVFPTEIAHWPPPSETAPRWESFEYDSLGRISFASFNGSELMNFPYDTHGDLILPGGISFGGPDDKININRTSRIFQFLNLDYSVNNLFIANAYNRYGLPTSISIPTNVGNIDFFRTIPYRTAEIKYNCK